MQFYEFMNIIYKNFGDRIFADSFEFEKKSYTKTDIMKNILNKFMIEEDDDFILFEGKDKDYLAKIYKGTESLPVNDAININTRMDLDTFKEFYEEADLPSDQIDNLINEFEKCGTIINVNSIEKDVFDCLKNILLEIINKKDKLSIRKAEIVGNTVTIGKKVFKLNEKLSSNSFNVNKNYKYIDALVKVYQQDSKITISDENDIEKLPIIYQKHFKIQRESFFSAESVLHQIRDAFYDGEIEFNNFKEEIYDGIEDYLIQKYKNGFSRVNKVLEIVIVANFSKSYLSKNNNGLIGPKEKKGIVHMLVNEDRIEWVTNYDEDI